MTDEQKSNQTINTGSIIGQNINIGSGSQTITGNQSFGSSTSEADAARAEVKALITELRAELAKLPADKSREVAALQLAVEDVEKEIAAPKPEASRLEIRGESLKKAAENLLAVAPIAGKIAVALLRLGA